MPTTRRDFIGKMLTLAGYTMALAFSKTGLASWAAADFSRQTFASTLKQLFPGQALKETNKIHLKLPRIARNGSVVPITITSSIRKCRYRVLFFQKKSGTPDC